MLANDGQVVWFTGLSASGKTTLATALKERLQAEGRATAVLDGDNVRAGLSRDLGFSPEDRAENIRRVSEVAKLFADSGLVTICAFISPYAASRSAAAVTIGPRRFRLVHLDVDVAVCEQRDPKGLYKKARAGELSGFTGIDAPYEKPATPALRLDTDALSVDECVAKVMALVASPT